ncbi:MAG: glycerate kinase [Pseudomonadota bacterium]
MKILIAPDSFKESLSAREVAEIIRAALSDVLPDAVFDLLPMADGGEGTVDAILGASGGEYVGTEVTGPLGEPLRAKYVLSQDHSVAVIEMAAACGLMLVPPNERDPLKTTSFGCGELIIDAISKGAKRIIFGIGGSATNDGGLGMCQALGAKFYDQQACLLSDPLTGADLERIAQIDLTELNDNIANVNFTAACDVDNPLLGPTGATQVFGPQKGASPAALERLELGLGNAFEIIETLVGHAIAVQPGSGAAGGMGAALLGILNGQLKTGVDVVADMVNLDERIQASDIVITGEGALDAQTAHGKAPAGVARRAKQYDIPVIAIGGMLAESAHVLLEGQIDAIEASVTRPCAGESALENAEVNLTNAARRVGHWIKLAQSL